MKNIVFIPNIDVGNGRSDNYNYSINSWKQWCDKNNCELIIWEDLVLPVEEMKITWQRYYVLDILEGNNAKCFLSVGVLTGAENEEGLSKAGCILNSVMDIKYVI